MKLNFVEPAYDEAKKHLLYMKILEDNRRLDIIAQPINPCIDDASAEVMQAFGSVILKVTDLREGVLYAPEVWSDLYEGEYSESVQAEVLGNAATQINDQRPELEDDERTVYVCPIVASSGVGYRHGYIAAWKKEDALTVAEFMAGGRADIYLELLDYNGEFLVGELLGDLSYSDVLCDMDDYRRIVEGETFAQAVKKHLGIEAPEPANPEHPGAELLETFRKLT